MSNTSPLDELPSSSGIKCPDVFQHVQSCPVCQRVFDAREGTKNNDDDYSWMGWGVLLFLIWAIVTCQRATRKG